MRGRLLRIRRLPRSHRLGSRHRLDRRHRRSLHSPHRGSLNMTLVAEPLQPSSQTPVAAAADKAGAGPKMASTGLSRGAAPGPGLLRGRRPLARSASRAGSIDRRERRRTAVASPIRGTPTRATPIYARTTPIRGTPIRDCATPIHARPTPVCVCATLICPSPAGAARLAAARAKSRPTGIIDRRGRQTPTGGQSRLRTIPTGQSRPRTISTGPTTTGLGTAGLEL